MRLGLPLERVMSMGSDELALWAEFMCGKHDIQYQQECRRWAMLAAVTWNSNGARPQKSVDDFMPRAQVTDRKSIAAMLRAWVRGMRR